MLPIKIGTAQNKIDQWTLIETISLNNLEN